MRLRDHQSSVLERIKAGVPVVKAWVHPGGGKSLYPKLAAIARPELKLCIITPRDSLRAQMEADFQDPSFAWLGTTGRIRAVVGSEINPSRGQAGFVTTYHSAANSIDILIDELRRHQYLLMLDEFHHLPKAGESTERPWTHAIERLVERAEVTVYATGTIERGDALPIFGIEYDPETDKPDFLKEEGHDWIVYGLTHALRDHSIIRTRFTSLDSRAAWIRNGETRQVEKMSTASEDDARAALYTSLKREYRNELLHEGLSSFRLHNLNTQYPSKCCVICAGISDANDVANRIKRELPELAHYVFVAHSDTQDAFKRIRKFRRIKRSAILVTVQMAYEGLDVKEIDHTILLTHIRSKPWIIQAINRGTRVRPELDWDKQIHHCFVPSDPMLDQIKREIEAEQDGIRPMHIPTECGRGRSGELIIPLDASATGKSASVLGGDPTGEVNRTYWSNVASVYDIENHPENLEKLIVAMSGVSIPSSAPGRVEATDLTPSEEESRLREAIQKATSAIDARNGWERGEMNGKLKARYGARENLTIDELRRQYAYVQGLLRELANQR